MVPTKQKWREGDAYLKIGPTYVSNTYSNVQISGIDYQLTKDNRFTLEKLRIRGIDWKKYWSTRETNITSIVLQQPELKMERLARSKERDNISLFLKLEKQIKSAIAEVTDLIEVDSIVYQQGNIHITQPDSVKSEFATLAEVNGALYQLKYDTSEALTSPFLFSEDFKSSISTTKVTPR